MEDGRPKNNHTDHHDKTPSQHYTLVFNSFVLMTLFNEINSRKLHDEKNVFAGLMNNNVFLGVIVASFAGQFLMVQFGGFFVGCAPLSLKLWLVSFLCGLSVFPVRYVNTFVPDQYFPTFGVKALPKVETDNTTVKRERKQSVIDAKGGARLDANNAMFARSNESKKWNNAMAARMGSGNLKGAATLEPAK